MRKIIYFWICLFSVVNTDAQENRDGNIFSKAFLSFSDSILIRNDSEKELAVLYKLAENKKVVAVGEVTHGTKEVLDFQKLIAENLVTSHGFNCIVLGEISFLDACKINDFVVNQNGIADNLNIKGKAKIQEVAYRQPDLIDLYIKIREFNKNRPFADKVWITGTDIDEPEEIIAFVEKYCGEQQIPDAMIIIERLNMHLKKGHRITKSGINAIAESTNQLIEMLQDKRNGTNAANMKIDLIVRTLQMLPQLVVFTSDSDLKYKMRDKFIFENINWLIKTCKKEKVVIIKAHNFHINRKTIYTEVFGKFPAFGEYLSKEYQQAYLAIGTEVQQGRFYTGSSNPAKIAQHKNKIGNIIGANTKAQYGLLLGDSTAKAFLNNPSYTISYGTVNYQSSLLINGKGQLGDAFDALIFIRNSKPYFFGKY